MEEEKEKKKIEEIPQPRSLPLPKNEMKNI